MTYRPAPPAAARNRAKTHCPLGHEYSTSNTLRVTRNNGVIARVCRECRHLARMARRDRLLAAERCLQCEGALTLPGRPPTGTQRCEHCEAGDRRTPTKDSRRRKKLATRAWRKRAGKEALAKTRAKEYLRRKLARLCRNCPDPSTDDSPYCAKHKTRQLALDRASKARRRLADRHKTREHINAVRNARRKRKRDPRYEHPRSISVAA